MDRSNRIIVDECLSPALVKHGKLRGYDCSHEQQIALFEVALDFIETLGDTVNRLIEVHSVDDIRLSNLPPADDEE